MSALLHFANARSGRKFREGVEQSREPIIELGPRHWEVRMKVKDAMHEGVTWVEPDTKIGELARAMRDEGIGSIPVGENDRLIGMVTDRDIATKAFVDGRDPASLTARDVMHSPILYCRTEEDVDDAARLMEQHQVRRLPVIDENKRMVGMLSLGDIASASSRELVGELTQAVAEHHA
jgi:CBS domain-containing protein